MKSLKQFICEGNQAHKLVEFAKKTYKDWDKELKQAMNEYENSLKDTDLMQKDLKKYLNNQYETMREFNRKLIELNANPKVAFSALLYQISFIKKYQTGLFKYGIDYLNKDFELRKFPEYNSKIDKIIGDLCGSTFKNIEDSVNNVNKTIKKIKDDVNDSLHNILNDDAMSAFVDKYKLVGIKYKNGQLEIVDNNAIFNKFAERVKEYIEEQNKKK